jgi:molecular chaperone Hsp33
MMARMSGPAGPAGAVDGDDEVLMFRTLRARAQGRIVRLGGAIDEILERHAYPLPVSEVLGQMVTLAAMLGTVLRPGGKLILQASTSGPVRMVAVNVVHPLRIRGLASFDNAKVAAFGEAAVDQAALLGDGNFAMTIDNGADEVRYQGIVPLSGESLTGAAQAYFRQSEQIPSFIRLAVARHRLATGAGGDRNWHWRAGGLLLQQLPSDVGHSAGLAPETAAEFEPTGDLDEEWTRLRMLSETIEDHELLDPTLSSRDLLWRLFHEEGVMTGASAAVAAHCSCSRERVETVLKGFGADDLADMREPDGAISVKCEYCAREYRFTESDVRALLGSPTS